MAYLRKHMPDKYGAWPLVNPLWEMDWIAEKVR
jgi:hypothetical protein